MLMKDQSRIKKAVRTTSIVVNSRDRNIRTYPNSSNFRYTLRRPLTNVTSIELVNGSIPALLYNIQPAWGSFTLQEGSVKYDISIPPGYYSYNSIGELLHVTQTAINAIPGLLNNYTVEVYDSSTRNYKIVISAILKSGSGDPAIPFALLFKSGNYKDEIDPHTNAVMSINTPARFLGFRTDDYISNFENLTQTRAYIMSPFPFDTINFIDRIYLHIDADGKNLDRLEQSVGRRDCFHIFFVQPYDGYSGVNYGYTVLDKQTITPIYTSSPAPLARVSNLEFSFRDEFNRLIDFNGREVNLIFEITHLE